MGKKGNYKGGKGGLAPHIRSRTTRSSRGRLVTSDDTSNHQLSSQLSMLGLYAAPTIGDGNCLFRALSDQLHGSMSLYAEVRQKVCDWIERHGERYEGFVEVDEGDESDAGGSGRRKGKAKVKTEESEVEVEKGPSKRLQAYLGRMRQNATYGGHMELSAFAHMTRRNIKVVQPGLVYVIEWRAGEPSPSDSKPTEQTSSPHRRRTTITAETVRGTNGYEEEDADADGGEEGEDGDEDGEEEQVEAELRGQNEDSGPTIYVAYHDWEHFSSIRNLRGPHSGLPNIRETPPQTEDIDVPSPADTAKEAAKEAERERKRERERKEKERKEKASLKVKLKIPPSSRSAAATPPPPPSSLVAAADPIQIQRLQQSLLPEASISSTSRSASPFPPSTQESAAEDSQPMTPMKDSEPPSLSVLSDGSDQAHLRSHSRLPHLQGNTPRAQYRSPKRTFDESSASGGEDEGREKRSRVRLGSVSLAGGPVDADADADVDEATRESMELDPDAAGGDETPGLSAPSSVASSAESVLSDSSSELSSPPSSSSPSPAPEPIIVAPPTPKKHYHSSPASEKTLTRRQRKALGLPKPRKGDPAGVLGTLQPSGRVSAGKITIPGGRWVGRPASAGVAVAGSGDAGDEEWRRNGTGRLDVRGFRELKI